MLYSYASYNIIKYNNDEYYTRHSHDDEWKHLEINDQAADRWVFTEIHRA